MIESDIVICNLALGHVGNSDGIASLTEASTPARACKQFYAQTVDEVLRDFDWPFARTFEALALVAEDPTTEWDFSYRYPNGALAVRRILSDAGRVDTAATRVPWILGRDSAGLLLFADKADAVVAYTARVDAVGLYPPDFGQAVALKLAAWIAPQVTGGDPAKLGARAFGLYREQLELAQLNALLEERQDLAPESDFLSARD